MIKVYSGFKGFAFLLFLIAAVVLCVSIFFWGMAKAIQLLLPLVIVLSYLLVSVFVLAILPAAFLKNLRPRLCVYSLLMSNALGTLTWMMSFFFVVKAFGFGGVFLAFLFQLLAPIALIGAVMKSSWAIVAHLSVWIIFTYAMRLYSQWLLKINSPKEEKGDIIDVDVIESHEQLE